MSASGVGDQRVAAPFAERATAVMQRPGYVRVGVSFALAVIPAIVLSAIVVGCLATFAVGSTSKVLSVLIGLVILGAIGAAAQVRSPAAIRLARPSWTELSMVGLWLGTVLLISRNTLRWSWFAPVTYSVDAAHHSGIVAGFVERWSMANGFDLTSYPLGAHASAALLQYVFRLSAVTAVWWIGIGSVFSSLLLVMVTAKTADGRRSWLGAPVALAVSLGAWRYTVGVVTWDFFFGLAVAVNLALAALALLAWGSGRVPVRAWLPSVAVIGMAIIACYPQITVAVPVAALAVGLCRIRRDRRFTVGQRRQRLRRAGGVFAATGIVGIGFLVLTGSAERIRLSLMVVEEGYVARPSIAAVGGWIAVAVFVLGLLVTLGGIRRVESNAVPVVSAFLSVVAVFGVMWLLRSRDVSETGSAISSYRIFKLWYVMVPMASVVAGLAVAPVVRAAGTALANRVMWLSVALVSVSVVVRPFPMSPTASPYVGRDEWRLAEWTRRHHDAKDVGLAGPGFAPYAIWWGALQRPTYGKDMYEDQRIAHWSDWPGGDHAERYLLVIGRRLIDDYLERPGVLPVRRIGRAALLERAGRPGSEKESDAASGTAEQGAPGL